MSKKISPAHGPAEVPVATAGTHASGASSAERYRARCLNRVPVPNTGRRGQYGWWRAPQTQCERRLNDSTRRPGLERLDEPPARPGRRGLHLVSDRDDRCRGSARSWKEQHRGRKAWDRRR